MERKGEGREEWQMWEGTRKVRGAKEGMFTVGREVRETGGWVKSRGGKEGRKGRND